MNTSKIKNDFAIFENRRKLVYLDNAATTQTPRSVVDAMSRYYEMYNANIHRGVYSLSAKASQLYEEAHQTVSEFINASFEEVVFTSGATQGLNMLAQRIGPMLTPEDNVVLTRMEHHANLVPWQQMAKQFGFELRFIEVTDDLRLDMQSAEALIDEHTKAVSFIHVSNSVGTINPAKKLIELAKERNAISIVDACQSIPHMPIDVRELGCDFLVFSGHKICGPTGIGVLYGKLDKLEMLEPFMYGGDMISHVSYEESSWNRLPWKFEAGTPHIAGGIGLGAAVEYLHEIGYEAIREHETMLSDYALEKLSGIEGLTVLGPKDDRIGIFSCVIKGVHHYDAGLLLDQYDVAVRTGHHCTQPLLEQIGLDGTIRLSLYFYNTMEDIDVFVDALREVISKLKS